MYTFHVKLILLVLILNDIVHSENVTQLNPIEQLFVARKLSPLCHDQLRSLDISTLLTMLDASEKLPVGVLIPHLYHLGQFDECYNIDYNSTIYGKYCLGNQPIEQLKNSQYSNNVKVPELIQLRIERAYTALHLGICLPAACLADDFHKLFDKLEFDESYCYSKATELKLSTGASITILILCVFLILLIISTIFDIYLFYTKKHNSHEFLVAFSALTNGRKLIQSSTNTNQLLCLNGVKAISMMWVVLGHEYLNVIAGPLTNISSIKKWLDDPSNMVISEGTVAVDTFLTISGLLLVYIDLKMNDRVKYFNIGLHYIHRYLRLTPLLAIIILIHVELIQYLGNGPLWKNIDHELVDDCKEYWWSALLYLQNYFHGVGTCVPQSWYLSLDFQLYLLSPIILILLRKSPKIGLCSLYICVISGFLVPALISYFYEIQESFTSQTEETTQKFMFRYYKQTYTRFGPYVIGMLLGYHVYKLKKNTTNIRLTQLTALALWCVSLTTLIACIFGPYDLLQANKFQWMDVVANGFIRNVWSIALCILILLCITGYGGPIDWFLSLPIFQLISKLSYAIYLTHYATIMVKYIGAKQAIFISNEYFMWNFWSDFIVICFISVLFHLMFEAPVVIIEKYIFSCCLKTRQSKT